MSVQVFLSFFEMQVFVPVHVLQKNSKSWRRYQQQPQEVKEEKPESFIVSTWKSFAKNTSIHGVHYLVEVSMNMMERMLWAFLVVLALGGMFYCCLLLSNRFKTSMTSTVFESTNFKTTEISFAAVTLCNNNRVDFRKTEAAVDKFVGNHSKDEKEIFVKFVKIFQNMEFGSFDEYEVLKDDDVRFLDKFNITDIYMFMMFDCKDFFVSCEWLGERFNCCDWFSIQRSFYGVCWSFNSITSVGSDVINVRMTEVMNSLDYLDNFQRSTNYPWRSPSSGKKSGLKVILNTHPDIGYDRSGISMSKPGIMAIVHNPSEWPSGSLFIGSGLKTTLSIQPTAFSTSEDVQRLKPVDRQCNYNVSLI